MLQAEKAAPPVASADSGKHVKKPKKTKQAKHIEVRAGAIEDHVH